MPKEFDNELKLISASVLQDAIAKAVSELVGEEYTCTVSNIPYDGLFGADLEVKLYKPLNFLTNKE